MRRLYPSTSLRMSLNDKRKAPALPTPLQNLQAIAAKWFVLSQLLFLLARQIAAMDKLGAHEAVHKAECLDRMAQVALFDVTVRYEEALALPKSDARTELIRQLDVTLFVLVGLRVLAWNVMLRFAEHREFITCLNARPAVAPALRLAEIINPVAALDSS